MVRERLTSYKLPMLISGTVAMPLLIAIGASVILLSFHPNNPLPEQVVKIANFPVYYPSPLPQGFGYKSGSARMDNGIVFYELLNGNTIVHVSEQRKPTSLPKLDTLSGRPLETPVGEGAILSGDGNSAIIIATSTTLITLSSSVPSATLSPIAKNMRNLN